MWDLIVSVPDHCLSFYFSITINFRAICNLFVRPSVHRKVFETVCLPK